MIQNYFADLNKDSYYIINTPKIYSKSFPLCVEYFGHYYAGERYYTKRKDYNSYLLLFTLKGEGQLEYGGKTYILGENQSAVFSCLAPQHYKTYSDEMWEFIFIHFNGPSSESYINLINNEELTINEEKTGFSYELSEIYKILKSSDNIRDVRACSQLTEILTQMISSRNEKSIEETPDKYRNDINNAIHYIDRHFTSPIKSEDILKTIPYSKYHFLRIFKSFTGQTLYSYLTNRRIHHSKTLLRGTDASVGDIALMSGFLDINCFIRSFKKNTGTTPLAYRKNSI